MSGERYEPISPDLGEEGGAEGRCSDEELRSNVALLAVAQRPPAAWPACAAAGKFTAVLLGALVILCLQLRRAPSWPSLQHLRGGDGVLLPVNIATAEGELVGLTGTSRKLCHTAVPGETCYKDVSWAMNDGIYAHPEWYEGLTHDSPFETFQAVVYKINSTMCPLPCNIPMASEERKKKRPKPVPEVEERPPKVDVSELPLPSRPAADTTCHTAVKGDPCYKAVRWAMTDGILEKPAWYEGLTPTSSFEAFQAKLHEADAASCPMPPCECHTTVKGERCHLHVLWVLKEGIDKHPEWYKDLTWSSRFEEVQLRLHEDRNTFCDKPCMPQFFGDPSFFCFSVFQSVGYEAGLMRAQLENRVGIFSCDEFAVVSDSNTSLGAGPYGPMLPLIIPHSDVGISKDNTAANTEIFINAWKEIYRDFRFAHHDWSLKVDPDAVILPDRLRIHLAPHTGKQVYVRNCNKFPGAPNWPMMFGSLEAISQTAIWTYMKNSEKCMNELEWEAWGEDLYLAECLDLIGCGTVDDFQLISDKVCLGVDCSDTWAAAFHPFKSQESWFECFNTLDR